MRVPEMPGLTPKGRQARNSIDLRVWRSPVSTCSRLGFSLAILISLTELMVSKVAMFSLRVGLTPSTAEGLSRVTPEKTAEAMQVTTSNPMVGVEGRTSLLFNLSKALKERPLFFGADGRPGNLIGRTLLV